MTETAIPVPDPVLTHDPAQPRRLGELLKLTVRLLADLPAPRFVWVFRGLQEIDLGFGSDLAALTRWASHYGQTITSEPTTDSDGAELVRHSLLVPNREGVRVEALAWIQAEQATG
jgi:hypothetical protein